MWRAPSLEELLSDYRDYLRARGFEEWLSSHPFAVDFDSEPWQLDLRPTLRAVVQDLRQGSSRATIAARFHNALIDATNHFAQLLQDTHP